MMADEGDDYNSEVTIDDVIAAENAERAQPLKLDGEDVPEEIRGKSPAEIADMVRRHQEALRISEDARLKALESRPAVVTPPAAPPAPEPVKTMTQEEFDALYESDPRAALQVYAELQEKRIMQNVEARISSLAGGTASSIETAMRERYKDEFELFDNEIKTLAGQVPDKALLANPQAWEQLISFVRGKPGNFEKLLEHRTQKTTAAAADAARQTQVTDSGFSSKGSVAPTGPKGSGDLTHYGLDETERMVADKLGISYADYAKQKRMR